MSRNLSNSKLARRSLLQSGAALGGIIATGIPLHRAFAAASLIKVDTRTIEVNKKAVKVFCSALSVSSIELTWAKGAVRPDAAQQHFPTKASSTTVALGR